MAPPHASEGGTLRSIPHYPTYELQGVPFHRISILRSCRQLLRRTGSHGLKARGFLRRRVKEELYITDLFDGGRYGKDSDIIALGIRWKDKKGWAFRVIAQS